MADQSELLNRKRRHDEHDVQEDISQEAKRTKEDEPDVELSTTKIIDVNYDCLEHIFKDFEFIDLFNVVDSNKHLVAVAGQIFKRKYHEFTVDIGISNCVANDGYFTLLTDCIWVTDRTAALKFLRHFGHAITKLKIACFSTDDTFFTQLHRYVHEYCSETLIEISFYYMIEFVLSSIEKPFPNVESVSFKCVKLNDNLWQLNRLFPNMRRLTLHAMDEVTNPMCIEEHFPNLQSLTIENQFERLEDRALNGFKEANIMEALRLNPNVQHLNLKYFDTKFLQKIGEYIQHVENLELSFGRWSSNHTIPTIRLENVKRLEIRMEWDPYPGFPELPFTFDHVEEFIYVTKPFLSCNIQSSDDFFIQNPLRKVHLQTINAKLMIEGDKLDLARALPLVTELQLETCELNAIEAADFINECPMLNEFQFVYTSPEEREKLRELFRGTKWESI
ncbi:uncharacterized protein LOC129568917 [Sitodiplosis mosellana]|uniref:uncharacterized protein LOC129568917 n=1 Tax=Sitodiplosis mosellana TaxID=263140 RepID=UPI0024440697|nr:uncharacterized protein LOC129568917 [Sitodiplosis mosellana]